MKNNSIVGSVSLFSINESSNNRDKSFDIKRQFPVTKVTALSMFQKAAGLKAQQRQNQSLRAKEGLESQTFIINNNMDL